MCTGMEVALVAAAAASAVSTVQGGRAAAAASEFEAQELETQKELSKLQTSDSIIKRREDAERLRRAQIARAAANGILPFRSASFAALLSEDARIAERDVRQMQLTGGHRTASFGAQASQSRIAGKQAIKSSVVSAGTSLISTGVTAHNSGMFQTVKPVYTPPPRGK